MSKKLKIWLFCLGIAFLFLMIASKSSFLYPFNNWMDANCFFTIGKGMLHGKVIYLDLFDQKGPLLFFYHMIAAIISYRSFLGVFIIEVVSFSFFLYYFYKTCHLYLKKITSLFTLPIISFLVLALPAFSHGDSAEEFCLPFLMYSLYRLIRYFKNKEKFSYSFFFINGLMAGLVFTIKYTMLGFWFAFMASFFFLLLFKKEYKKAFTSCLVFLFGMFLPVLPWLIYFGLNHAMGSFVDSYLLFNLKYYPGETDLIYRILMIFTKPLHFMASNTGVGLFILLGILYFCLSRKMLHKRHEKLILVTTFFFLCVSVFIGGVSFRYYYLILTPFTVLGVIALGSLFEKNEPKMLSENKVPIFLIVTTLFFCLTFYGSSNTQMLKPSVDKEDLVQYQFAKIIEKKKDATILNYGFLDGGFYTVTGKLPVTRYFQKQNISDEIYPDIMKAQNKLVKDKKVDFVITRVLATKQGYQTKYLELNYKVRKRKCTMYEEKKFCYTLWQKKEN